MAGDYYDHTTYPSQGAVGSSSAARAEFELIEVGFNKLPGLTGNGGKLVAINAAGTAQEAITTTGTGSGVRATGPTLTSPAISGGTINGTPIGSTTPSTVAATTLNASGKVQGQVVRIKDANYSELYFSTSDDGGAGALTYNHATNTLHLYTGGGSRAAVSSTGLTVTGAISATLGFSSTEQNIINQPNNNMALNVRASNAGMTGNVLSVTADRNTTNASYNLIAAGCYAVADRFIVRDSGNVVNTNNSYGAISDIKFKENIVNAAPKLAKLLQVRIVNYNLKTAPTQRQLGVIAQELELISPGLIEETPDYINVEKIREVEVPAIDAVFDDEGGLVTPATEATTKFEEYIEREPAGTVTKSVKYSVFVPMLIKAMQEQQEMIVALQVRIDALEAA